MIFDMGGNFDVAMQIIVSITQKIGMFHISIYHFIVMFFGLSFGLELYIRVMKHLVGVDIQWHEYQDGEILDYLNVADNEAEADGVDAWEYADRYNKNHGA